MSIMLRGCRSLQGEREFHNEPSLSTCMAGACGACAGNVISLLGYCCDVRCRRKKMMMIVYEYMQNESLQDALLYRESKVLGLDESEIFKSFIECGEEEGDLETETIDGDYVIGVDW
nr:receptor-like serine/threonine-protein kinase At2g45590 [Tanacetum cinerariifolium]